MFEFAGNRKVAMGEGGARCFQFSGPLLRRIVEASANKTQPNRMCACIEWQKKQWLEQNKLKTKLRVLKILPRYE